MEKQSSLYEQQQQLYRDLRDVFGTAAGERVLAWWCRQSRQGHSILVPNDPISMAFYSGRQADVNQVVKILATPEEKLLAGLQERIERQEAARGADPLWGPGGADDFLFPRKDRTDEGRQ